MKTGPNSPTTNPNRRRPTGRHSGAASISVVLFVIPEPFRSHKMTIAVGFNATDGVVLCADSLESGVGTKRIIPKLWCYQVAEEWGIAIASAGDGDLADSFNENLESILGNSDFDEERLMLKLRTAISHTRHSYPDAQLQMLIAIFGPTFPLRPKLYRVYQEHLGPVSRYQSVGCGSPIADLICSQIQTPLLNVEESIRLGILAIARTKEQVEGCGGPTSVLSFTRGGTDWRLRTCTEIDAIEDEFSLGSFRGAMQDYWVSKNPNSSWPGGYRWIPERTVQWKKSAKLNTQD
jgi:20S proteasome alpha/beta subunit